MESLITVMNKLQDVFSTIGSSQKIDLPQIVVVGSQSSGKSSVLESLVGKSFLPRGTGIVTRAPLVIHIIRQSYDDSENIKDLHKSKDWATFLHKPNEIYYDFNNVKKEIENKTAELTGGEKNITDVPIVLNVYSKLMYNLSFVDLPGLTKNPVGDQPADIEQKIKKLVFKFIENPNSIILAVVTANTDPATSESLHIAKSVDPNGDRTIAVVTKIDIMDAGTDANDFLTGKVIPVKLGIIGVINRSQKDINEKKSIKDSLEAEKNFFKIFYPKIAEKHGTKILGKRLQYLLIQKIKETYPDLKRQIYDMHTQYSAKLGQLKEFTDNYDRSLLDLITQTALSYKASLEGHSTNIGLKELNGGASIAQYFKYSFKRDIDAIDPLNGISPDDIINVINNASGTSMGVFMPAQAFDHLVRKQLILMEAPSISCVNHVYEELILNMSRLDDGISRELKKYPILMDKINEVLQNQLSKYKQKTIDAVCKLIRYQEAYINTDHPDFIEAIMESEEYYELFEKSADFYQRNELNELPYNDHTSIQETNNRNCNSPKNKKSSTKETMYKMRQTVEKISTYAFSGYADIDKLILESRAGLITLFIKCYFKVIKKIIQDSVPKTIMFELVNNIKLNFQKNLTSKVYKSNDLKMAELLMESAEIVDERIKVTNRVNSSEKALKLLREIESLCMITNTN